MKDNKQYGLPKVKKFPMPDKRHVRSAIRFFNYATPSQEKELARAIIRKMKKYGLKFTDFNVGDENRFRKYVPEKYLTHVEGEGVYYKEGTCLAHYGKKGMNWGLRTSQPYGTGYIRKNGKRGIERIGGDSSLADPEIVDPNEDSEINILDPDSYRKSEEEHQKSNKKELRKFILKTLNDDLEGNKLGLIKDSVRAGEAAVAGIKTWMNDRRISKLESDSENSELKIKDRHWSEEEDMAAVNPSYRNFDTNTKNNCMLCTTTYDLRRRGYDVTAEKASSGYYTNEIRRWYPDAKTKKAYTATTYSDLNRARNGQNTDCTKNTVKALLKQPDGARGNLTVSWGAGGGHSVVYEVKERQVVIRDCQTNKTYKGRDVGKILNSCTSAEYTRLDNVRVDKRAVSEVIKG